MKYDRIAAMNRAKDSKPATGGKIYKRAAQRRETPVLGTWERLAGLTAARWECAAACAVEDFLRAAFPERYEALEF